MTRIFYYAWEKPACCVSKISSDCGCQSKETGVGMEVRLLSVGARGFFSSLRDSPSRLRRSILSLPTRKNTSGTQGNGTIFPEVLSAITVFFCFVKTFRPIVGSEQKKRRMVWKWSSWLTRTSCALLRTVFALVCLYYWRKLARPWTLL